MCREHPAYKLPQSKSNFQVLTRCFKVNLFIPTVVEDKVFNHIYFLFEYFLRVKATRVRFYEPFSMTMKQ